MTKKSTESSTLFMSDTLETTLCIIKPEAMEKRMDILRFIMKKGFRILARRRLHLSPEQAADFYVDQQKTKYYMTIVHHLSNGPLEAVLLTKENAIDDFIGLIGPESLSAARRICPGSLRALYGDCRDDLKNGLHGSINEEAAAREIHFFFPNFIVEPITKNDAKKLCFNPKIIEPLMTGLQQLSKAKPNDSVLWLAKWLLENNSERPTISETTLEEYELNQKICQLHAQPDEVESPPKMPAASNSSVVGSSTLIIAGSNKCTSSSSEDINLSSELNLGRTFFCCNVEVDPKKIGICPICKKCVQYTVPMQKASDSSSSTASSSTSNTSILSTSMNSKTPACNDPCRSTSTNSSEETSLTQSSSIHNSTEERFETKFDNQDRLPETTTLQ